MANATAVKPVEKEKQYITIPEKDVFDNKHHSIFHNRDEFKAGQTYLVDADVAADINERLAKVRSSQIRLIRPNSPEALTGNQNQAAPLVNGEFAG